MVTLAPSTTSGQTVFNISSRETRSPCRSINKPRVSRAREPIARALLGAPPLGYEKVRGVLTEIPIFEYRVQPPKPGLACQTCRD